MITVQAESACDVCLETYTVSKAPYAIPCGHVFCSPCLQALRPSTCPLCRHTFDRRYLLKLHLDRPEDGSRARRRSQREREAQAHMRRLTQIVREQSPLTDYSTSDNMKEIRDWLHARRENDHPDLRTSMTLYDRGAGLQARLFTSEADRRVATQRLTDLEAMFTHERETTATSLRKMQEYCEIIRLKYEAKRRECEKLTTRLEAIRTEIALAFEPEAAPEQPGTSPVRERASLGEITLASGDMSVEEIREAARANTERTSSGSTSVMALIRGARSHISLAQGYENSGSLREAYASYIQAVSLVATASGRPELKQEQKQPEATQGLVGKEWNKFIQEEGKDLYEKVRRVERKLKDVEQPPTNVADIKRSQSYLLPQRAQQVNRRSSMPSMSMRSTLRKSKSSERFGVSAIALYDFTAAEEGEMSISKGERIELVDEPNQASRWWSGVGAGGKSGLFPANYVQVVREDEQPRPAARAAAQPQTLRTSASHACLSSTTVSKPSASRVLTPQPTTSSQVATRASPRPSTSESRQSDGEGTTAVAIYDFHPASQSELSFNAGDRISHIDHSQPQWWHGKALNGRVGWFPATHVRLEQSA